MKFLLDTNACIHYLNHPNSPIRQRMESLSPEDVVICSVVKAELYYGANKSQRKSETLEGLRYFFDIFSRSKKFVVPPLGGPAWCDNLLISQ